MTSINPPTLSLKLAENPIDSNDPWVEDALERKPIAEALTNLIRNESSPLVLSLNGCWGSGKTFLLKRWQADLERQGFRSLYFNAWEDDSLGDPLIAIFGQLWQSIKGSDLAEIQNTLKEVAKASVIETAFNIVRAGTVGAIDLTPEKLKSVAEHAVDDYFERHSNRNDLRKRLSDVAIKVTEGKTGPLVFIIDELDRCRPTFAVEVLERIKHVCSVPNIVFVLGIDRDQLGAAIQSVYGSINTDGYLRRFFDMEFSLPAIKRSNFCSHLLKRHGLDTYFLEQNIKHRSLAEDFQQFRSFFSDICDHFGLSLREIEHAIRIFVFVSRNIGRNTRVFPELLTILILMRIINGDLYNKFTNSERHSVQVLNFFESFIKKQKLHSGIWLTALIHASDTKEYDRENLLGKQINELATGTPPLSLDLISNWAKSLNPNDSAQLSKLYFEFVGRGTWNYSRNTVSYLVGLIELVPIQRD